ncbi:hypothetical protein ACFLQ9_00880 [Bacteroidota bacterium]
MNKVKLLLTLVTTIIIGIGINITHNGFLYKKDSYIKSLDEYNRSLEKHRDDSIKYIRGISAPQNAISYKVSSAAEAYQSASQGIDVQLKGLSWRGYFLDQNQNIMDKLSRDFDAYYKGTVDKIAIDPDFPDNGYPDLIVDIKNSPSFYRPTLFSEYLGNIGLAKPRPYKSYELNSCDKRKAVMDLWLVTFDITFRIEPNFEHSRNNEIEFTGKHLITRNTNEKIRKQKEYNDMRYDRMAVFLEFKPKKLLLPEF